MAASGTDGVGPPAPVRPQRAQRIAADPRPVGRPVDPDPEPPPPRRRSWHLLGAVRAALGLAVVAAAFGAVVQYAAADRSLSAPASPWATGAPRVPVPGDAAAAPLGEPAPAPPGEGGFAFSLEHGGRPVAFDPCRPVHYVTRYDGAPPGAERLVQAAVAQLSAATGLVLVHDGATDETPSASREAYQPSRYGERWAPVLVSWADADLAAGPVAVDPDGRGPRLVSGQVVLDTAAQEPASVMQALLSQLGALAGLEGGDASATATFSPGARRGLHQLGQGPCFS